MTSVDHLFKKHMTTILEKYKPKQGVYNNYKAAKKFYNVFNCCHHASVFKMGLEGHVEQIFPIVGNIYTIYKNLTLYVKQKIASYIEEDNFIKFCIFLYELLDEPKEQSTVILNASYKAPILKNHLLSEELLLT